MEREGKGGAGPKDAPSRQRHSLVVEHNVRDPDHLRGHPDGGDIVKVCRVPAQLVVTPLLEGDMEGRASGGPGSGGTELSKATFFLLLWQHPSSNSTMEMPPSPPGQGLSAPKAVASVTRSCPCPREGTGSYLLQPDICGHHLVLFILRWGRGRGERTQQEPKALSHQCTGPQITAFTFCPLLLGFSFWEQLVPVQVQGDTLFPCDICSLDGSKKQHFAA